MIIRTVTSDKRPSNVQLLQGKKLINIDVTDTSETVDNIVTTTFSFTQLVVDVSDDADNAILEYRAEVAQQYLSDTDYINDKYTEEVTVLKTSTTDEFAASHSEKYTLREAAREAIRKLEDA